MTDRIGIIGAMEDEVTTLIAAMENKTTERIGIVYYHTGTLDGQDVVIARSGIGKVNAALTAAEMIRTYGAKIIINTGIAGAIDDSLAPEDSVVATDLVQHDYDTSPLGEPGFVSGVAMVRFPADPTVTAVAVAAARSLGVRVLTGTIASGDQFISDVREKERIKNSFGALACEMEGAAIAHACVFYRVRFAVIRTISDRADGSAEIDYPTFAVRAAARNAEIVRKVVSAIR